MLVCSGALSEGKIISLWSVASFGIQILNGPYIILLLSIGWCFQNVYLPASLVVKVALFSDCEGVHFCILMVADQDVRHFSFYADIDTWRYFSLFKVFDFFHDSTIDSEKGSTDGANSFGVQGCAFWRSFLFISTCCCTYKENNNDIHWKSNSRISFFGWLVKIVPSSGDPCMSYNFVRNHSFVGDNVFGVIFDVRNCNLVHLEDVFVTAG